MPESDYVSIVYNETDKPLTDYPAKLTRYLSYRFGMNMGCSLLDIGCGRGEFLKGFIDCGLKGQGIDRSLSAGYIVPEARICQSDIAEEPLPYGDSSFDYVFSKSVIEHFYYPENLIQEIYRILKPGGTVITMTPDWESVYKIFYEDYTHRTPFTLKSLRDIFHIHGFGQVNVEKFMQLPFIWERPWLKPLCRLIALTAPSGLSPYSKLVRFSKEIMLLGSAVKPL